MCYFSKFTSLYATIRLMRFTLFLPNFVVFVNAVLTAFEFAFVGLVPYNEDNGIPLFFCIALFLGANGFVFDTVLPNKLRDPLPLLSFLVLVFLLLRNIILTRALRFSGISDGGISTIYR